MKIAIIGYSGSGKSTLARKLALHYGIPVLHLDAVHHLPGWQARDRYRAVLAAHGEKAVVIKNQKQLDQFEGKFHQ